jgi:hypothetical protein
VLAILTAALAPVISTLDTLTPLFQTLDIRIDTAQVNLRSINCDTTPSWSTKYHRGVADYLTLKTAHLDSARQKTAGACFVARIFHGHPKYNRPIAGDERNDEQRRHD